MKKTAACLFVLFLFCLITALPFTALAAGGTYSISQVDFAVVIHEDGSADVTETWTVNFESGVFTRFFKDVVLDSGSSMEYDSVRVSIDGIACEETEETEKRPDYCYHVGGGSVENSVELSAYLFTKEATHTYVFSYRLNKTVGQKKDRYFFHDQLIGEKFQKKVKYISLSVTVPEAVTVTDTQLSTGSFEQHGQTFKATVKNKSELWAMLYMDVPAGSDIFAFSPARQAPHSRSALDKYAWIIPVAFFAAVFIFPGVIIFRRTSKAKLMMRAIDPPPGLGSEKYSKAVAYKNEVTKALYRLAQIEKDPLALAVCISGKGGGLLFPATLATMYKQGRVDFGEDKNTVRFWIDPSACGVYADALWLLVRCRNRVFQVNATQNDAGTAPETFGGELSVSVEDLGNCLLDNSMMLRPFMTRFQQLGAVTQKRILAVSTDRDQTKKDLRMLHLAFCNYEENYSLQRLCTELDGTTEDVMRYCRFFGMKSNHKTEIAAEGCDGMLRLDLFVRRAYENMTKDSGSGSYDRSTDSNCSGCSSCSSCGGGGAD